MTEKQQQIAEQFGITIDEDEVRRVAAEMQERHGDCGWGKTVRGPHFARWEACGWEEVIRQQLLVRELSKLEEREQS